MVRIEKAYTGYCIHQEEASQTLQELEKNEHGETMVGGSQIKFMI